MPLAKDVASELRKLADALDKSPETLVVAPYVSMYNSYSKEAFLNFARIMPRPIKKEVGGSDRYPDLVLVHENENIRISSRIAQSDMCELVEPAKPAVYRCTSILSPEEDAALELEVSQ